MIWNRNAENRDWKEVDRNRAEAGGRSRMEAEAGEREGAVKVEVQAARPYPVWIGRNLLASAGEIIMERKEPCRVAIITDYTTGGLFENRVERSLKRNGFTVTKLSIPPGEGSKNMSQLAEVLEFLAESGLTRSDLIAALGGGVVGDLAGFAAAVYQRGVDYIQLPTTFLAAIDSSVGGKTAVDLGAGKNLAGAFHQPLSVICDCDTFRTLPEKVFADGAAEAVKYGVLAGGELFGQMISGKGGRSGLPEELLPSVVEQCVRIKADIVNRDEFDRGERQLLNLGHTIGHAVERCSGYGITHGHAVAMGMAAIAKAAAQLKGTEEAAQTAEQIIQALRIQNLPTEIPYSPEDIYRASLSDKKKTAAGMQVIVPETVGCCKIRGLSLTEWRNWVGLALGETESAGAAK